MVVVKELSRRPGQERPPGESGVPRKEALRKNSLFHQWSHNSHTEQGLLLPPPLYGRLGVGVGRGWPLVTQLLRPSAHALWRRGRPGTAKVAARVGAARVLGFGEDSQMAAPPDAKSQGPVSRFSPFRPLGVARGRQL